MSKDCSSLPSAPVIQGLEIPGAFPTLRNFLREGTSEAVNTCLQTPKIKDVFSSNDKDRTGAT